MRRGSRTAPGWMNVEYFVGIGLPHRLSVRKVPTWAMADAPGMFMATTRALMPGTGAAQTLRRLPTWCRAAIPTAEVIMPRTVRLLISRMGSLLPCMAQSREYSDPLPGALPCMEPKAEDEQQAHAHQ